MYIQSKTNQSRTWCPEGLLRGGKEDVGGGSKQDVGGGVYIYASRGDESLLAGRDLGPELRLQPCSKDDVRGE